MLVPWGLGQREGGRGGPNWGTQQSRLCRQHRDRGAGRETFVSLGKKRTLIGDALERVFENLAWKYHWG